jgi:hypothetical protein
MMLDTNPIGTAIEINVFFWSDELDCPGRSVRKEKKYILLVTS